MGKVVGVGVNFSNGVLKLVLLNNGFAYKKTCIFFIKRENIPFSLKGRIFRLYTARGFVQ